MPHNIYQTEGIVLRKRDFGEAERVYNIYTEKFGMITVAAQGVRFLKSKLRYNLDLFAFGNFSLVAGKNIWRITDTEEVGKINGENLEVFSRISNFLLRMIKGEERNEFVWQKIKKFFWDGGDEVETITVILHDLGYMSDIPDQKREKIKAINKALKESML